MSDPTITCTACGITRNCYLHIRAEHPPTAAKRYLKKHCHCDGNPCEFAYRAGVDVTGLIKALKKQEPDHE